jgi:hypothetical protein
VRNLRRDPLKSATFLPINIWEDQWALPEDNTVELSAEILHSAVASVGNIQGERRKFDRVPMRFKVKIIPYDNGVLGDSVFVWTRDISPGGIGIMYHKKMKDGKRFIIRLPSEDNTPILLLCTVRACLQVAAEVFNIGASFAEVAEPLDSDCRLVATRHFQPELAIKFAPESSLPSNLTEEIRRISEAILS